jgi:hypothetical protein
MMDTTSRDEIKRRLEDLPEPPFFARLLDPRQDLSAAQRAQHPELLPFWDTKLQASIRRSFMVVKMEMDRDPQHPGIWLLPSGCAFWVAVDWVEIMPFFNIN